MIVDYICFKEGEVALAVNGEVRCPGTWQKGYIFFVCDTFDCKFGDITVIWHV